MSDRSSAINRVIALADHLSRSPHDHKEIERQLDAAVGSLAGEAQILAGELYSLAVQIASNDQRYERELPDTLPFEQWRGPWLRAQQDLRERFLAARSRLLALVEPRVIPFIPTPAQEAILKALDGKAMNQTGLENVMGIDRRQLHRKTGLKDLMERGLIFHGGPGVGYYRKDRPPPNALPG